MSHIRDDLRFQQTNKHEIVTIKLIQNMHPKSFHILKNVRKTLPVGIKRTYQKN